MKKTITIASSITVCMICLMGCAKLEPSEPEQDIHMLYGNYTLSDIHWPGTSVDLNNDGIGFWDLLYEFQNKIGYYEPDYTAVVTEGTTYSYKEPHAKKSTAFNVVLPYPYYVEDQGIWRCIEIRTLKYSVRATEESFHLVSNCCETKPGFNDPTDLFLSNVSEISLVVDSYTDNVFKIGLECILPHDIGESQTLDKDYMYYEFIKTSNR